MSFYWIKTNQLIKKVFKNYIWNIPNNSNTIYLTFDDGPTLDVTEWVLEELKKNEIKATFFCIGKNIQSNPALFEKIQQEGHAIGNHTFNHVKGWNSKKDDYLNNVAICQSVIEQNNYKTETKLFRPPYGKITKSQSSLLRKQGYKIIMWDVLSADFDQSITPEKCAENVIKNVQSGSIIVFHDSIKAAKNMQYALPKAIRYLKANGFTFEVIR